VLFGPYHRNTVIRTDTTCCRVIFLSKVVTTQVHMPSPRSVQRHWPFQHCFQILCVLVLHSVRNRTKIESGSFPMSLFLWSTVWYSLLILRMKPVAPATLNSWTSWLWSHNSSPPLSPKTHCVMLENQVIWLHDLGFCIWDLDGLRRKIACFDKDLKAVPDKFKSPGTKNLCESFERIVKTWSYLNSFSL